MAQTIDCSPYSWSFILAQPALELVTTFVVLLAFDLLFFNTYSNLHKQIRRSILSKVWPPNAAPQSSYLDKSTLIEDVVMLLFHPLDGLIHIPSLSENLSVRITPLRILWILTLFSMCGSLGAYRTILDLRATANNILNHKHVKILVEFPSLIRFDLNTPSLMYLAIECENLDFLKDAIIHHLITPKFDLVADGSGKCHQVTCLAKGKPEVSELLLSKGFRDCQAVSFQEHTDTPSLIPMHLRVIFAILVVGYLFSKSFGRKIGFSFRNWINLKTKTKYQRFAEKLQRLIEGNWLSDTERDIIKRRFESPDIFEFEIDASEALSDDEFLDRLKTMCRVKMLMDERIDLEKILNNERERLRLKCPSITHLFWAVSCESKDIAFVVRLDSFEIGATSLPEFLTSESGKSYRLEKFPRVINPSHQSIQGTKHFPASTPATPEDVCKAMELYSSDIMNRKGVSAAFGSPFRLRGGKSVNENCLVVVVYAKGWLCEGEDELPSYVDVGGGRVVGVDVRQGALELWGGGSDSATKKSDTLRMGTDIGPQSSGSGAGTLGVFATRTVSVKKSGKEKDVKVAGFVTCCHPFVNMRDEICEVWHPSGHNQGYDQKEKTLISEPRSFIGNPPWKDGNKSDPLDAAFFELHSTLGKKGFKFSPTFVVEDERFWKAVGIQQVPELTPESEGVPCISPGESVFKVGRTTGVTKGKWMGCDGKAKAVGFEDHKKKKTSVVFSGLDVIENVSGFDRFGDKGDSGSLVFRLNTKDNSKCFAVDILLGGLGDSVGDWRGVSFSMPMSTILERLGVELIFPGDLPSPSSSSSSPKNK